MSPKAKKILQMCGIYLLVWLVFTSLFSISSWSVLPIAAEALGIEGGFTNATMMVNMVVTFVITGLITLVGMIALTIVGFVFVRIAETLFSR